jgi:hypothetical protein
MLDGMRGVVNPQDCGWAEAKGIVLQHPDPMHSFQMTMTFAEEAGKTRRTWWMRFESAAEFEKVREFIPAVNEQNFSRLEAQLATMA